MSVERKEGKERVEWEELRLTFFPSFPSLPPFSSKEILKYLGMAAK